MSQSNNYLVIIIILLTIITVIAYASNALKNASQNLPKIDKENFIEKQENSKSPQKIKTPTPIFSKYLPIRKIKNSNFGKVVSDIESHLPQGHIYSDYDLITSAHEGTHGIHARLRMKESGSINDRLFLSKKLASQTRRNSAGKINCFYVLENKYVVIEEPPTTIRAIASKVPQSLRGNVFNLYLVQQARSWNEIPLYMFDEWVAYANGSTTRLDLKITKRSETVSQMLEFNVYSICVAMASESNDPQLRDFLMWHLKRCMDLYEQNESLGTNTKAAEYLKTMRESSDAEEFRAFARRYFGEDWTNKVLKF